MLFRGGTGARLRDQFGFGSKPVLKRAALGPSFRLPELICAPGDFRVRRFPLIVNGCLHDVTITEFAKLSKPVFSNTAILIMALATPPPGVGTRPTPHKTTHLQTGGLVPEPSELPRGFGGRGAY